MLGSHLLLGGPFAAEADRLLARLGTLRRLQNAHSPPRQGQGESCENSLLA